MLLVSPLTYNLLNFKRILAAAPARHWHKAFCANGQIIVSKLAIRPAADTTADIALNAPPALVRFLR